MNESCDYKHCGESLNPHGIIICRLGCRQCHEPCERKKTEQAKRHIVELLMGNKEDKNG